MDFDLVRDALPRVLVRRRALASTEAKRGAERGSQAVEVARERSTGRAGAHVPAARRALPLKSSSARDAWPGHGASAACGPGASMVGEHASKSAQTKT